RLDELTGRPFGVNLFVPGPAGDVARVRQFAAEIESDVSGAGARLGEPRHDDDDWDAKIGYLMGAPADVVSFTFGIPGEDVIAGLRARGTEVWVTVTSPDEARRAAAAGADLLVVQGYEAGGDRGGARDAPGGGAGPPLSERRSSTARRRRPHPCTGPRCTMTLRRGSPGRSAAGPRAGSRTASCAPTRNPLRRPTPRCTTSHRRCGRPPARLALPTT